MKPVRLTAPLGSFGLVVGLATAAAMMPDGCGIDAAQSERLRLGVPLVTPLVFVALGVLLPRIRGWVSAFGWSVAAIAVWPVAIALVYGGPQRLGLTGVALMMVVPFVVATLAAAPLWLRWARLGTLDGPDGASARALVWCVVAAAAKVSVCVYFLRAHVQLDLRLAVATVVGMAVLAAVASLRKTSSKDRPIAHALRILACLGIVGAALQLSHQPPPAAPPTSFSFWHGC